MRSSISSNCSARRSAIARRVTAMLGSEQTDIEQADASISPLNENQRSVQPTVGDRPKAMPHAGEHEDQRRAFELQRGRWLRDSNSPAPSVIKHQLKFRQRAAARASRNGRASDARWADTFRPAE